MTQIVVDETGNQFSNNTTHLPLYLLNHAFVTVNLPVPVLEEY